MPHNWGVIALKKKTASPENKACSHCIHGEKRSVVSFFPALHIYEECFLLMQLSYRLPK